MAIQLTDATLLINNESVGIVPNSLKYTEGFGETTMRAMSTGGGRSEPVFANNIETQFSKVMFDMPTTPANIKLARQWKNLQSANVAQIAGETSEGNVTKTFTQAAVVNDYEVEIGTEGNISIEMQSNSAI